MAKLARNINKFGFLQSRLVVVPMRCFRATPYLCEERKEVSATTKVHNSATGMCMPALILGTWKIDKPEVAAKVISAALKLGFRAIDTAAHYGNEEVIGAALEKALCDTKVPREELFIIGKLGLENMRCEKVQEAMCRTLHALKQPYVDLYMINFPAGVCKDAKGCVNPDPKTDLKGLWKGLEALVGDGKAKYLGVANFSCQQLTDLTQCAEIKPSTVMVEVHPYFMQNQFREFAKSKCMTVAGFAPLGRSSSLMKWIKEKGGKPEEKPNPADDPCVVAIAKKVVKSPQQLVLRYLLQSDDNLSVVVGSPDPKLIMDNMDLFDFCLTTEDVCKLKKMDKGNDGRLFDKCILSFLFPGVADHPNFPF